MLLVGLLAIGFYLISQTREINDWHATTAEEYLEIFDRGDFTYQFTSDLSPEESLKVAEVLRARFPVVSMRERLSVMQSKHPTSSRRVERAVDVSKNRYPHIKIGNLNSLREGALASLHSENVHEFVNRAGQGFGRFADTINPYEIHFFEDAIPGFRPPETPVHSGILGEPQIQLERAGSKRTIETRRSFSSEGMPGWGIEQYNLYRSPGIGDEPRSSMYYSKPVNRVHLSDWHGFDLSLNGMPREELPKWFHNYVTNGFADSRSLGYVKDVDHVTGFHSHRVRIADDWNGLLRMQHAESRKPETVAWKTNRLQLVSLLLHDTPRVYVSDSLPNMEDLSGTDVETRPLNDFEREALEKLDYGNRVVISATPNRIVMLGAIRSSANCSECHSKRYKHDLLGAFTYEFLREPAVDISQPLN